MTIFPNLCLWRRSLCSNLGGTDPEKLYRATLILQNLFIQERLHGAGVCYGQTPNFYIFFFTNTGHPDV